MLPNMLVSRINIHTVDRIHALAPFINPSVGVSLLSSSYHIFVLAIGTVKLYQFHRSKDYRAHKSPWRIQLLLQWPPKLTKCVACQHLFRSFIPITLAIVLRFGTMLENTLLNDLADFRSRGSIQ